MCTVGLRSRDSVNVAKIAEKYGGGGHRLAAGLSMNGKVNQVVHTLVDAFSSVFSQDTEGK
jgi:phosphoesterase RecJ-like protein